ncbi:hypothetical protein [Nannocystis pusilla]|uniref:hypothetical protein n=1 Tax=Nannocystis pusilla TaxID=889268 RepID=UPI003B76D0C0
MKFHIADHVKARIVKYGHPTLFGPNRRALPQDAAIKLFDQVWNSGLRKELEDAIARKVSYEPNVVIERMESASMSYAVNYVDTSGASTLYECTFKVLCVAQVKSHTDVHTIDQMWFFAYGGGQPKLFCFEFATEEEKREFLAFAKKEGAKLICLRERLCSER